MKTIRAHCAIVQNRAALSRFIAFSKLGKDSY